MGVAVYSGLVEVMEALQHPRVETSTNPATMPTTTIYDSRLRSAFGLGYVAKAVMVFSYRMDHVSGAGSTRSIGMKDLHTWWWW
jgi:hypothetical protein